MSMKSCIFLVLLAILNTGLCVSPRPLESRVLSALQTTTTQKFRLQADPDPACVSWLLSSAGQDFANCQNLTNASPVMTPENNCSINATNYDNFCKDPCYNVLVNGYDHIIKTGDCRALFDDLFAPCMNDTNCATDGSSICHQGVCYSTCNQASDCNNCTEACQNLVERNTSVCQSTLQTTGNSSYTFAGAAYTFKYYCAKSETGNYCSLSSSGVTSVSNVTCDQFASWGCCLGTWLLTSSQCQFRAVNSSTLYQCNNSNTLCPSMPDPTQYCSAANNVSSGLSSAIAGVSSAISSIVGIISGTNDTWSSSGMSSTSVMIGVPGSSSVVVIVNPNNNTVGTGSGAGRENAPWLLVLGLLFTLLFSS